jgi:hypothetical protein
MQLSDFEPLIAIWEVQTGGMAKAIRRGEFGNSLSVLYPSDGRKLPVACGMGSGHIRRSFWWTRVPDDLESERNAVFCRPELGGCAPRVFLRRSLRCARPLRSGFPRKSLK